MTRLVLVTSMFIMIVSCAYHPAPGSYVPPAEYIPPSERAGFPLGSSSVPLPDIQVDFDRITDRDRYHADKIACARLANRIDHDHSITMDIINQAIVGDPMAPLGSPGSRAIARHHQADQQVQRARAVAMAQCLRARGHPVISP